MFTKAAFFKIKNTVKTAIFLNIIAIKMNCFLFEYILKRNLFLWCKAVFSASLLQSSVSHDPSEIILICWFAAQETFIINIIIIINVTVVLVHIFVETFIHFSGLFDE